VGFTNGFDEVELNPDGLDDHEYVLPFIEVEPIVSDWLKHI